MYTIFVTINCVEQLTFFKTFVDQLQFEQSLIFCLKVKLLENDFQYRYGRWFSIFDQLSLFWHLLEWCRAVVFFVSTSFFELSQFEQLNISHLHPTSNWVVLLICFRKNNNNNIKSEINHWAITFYFKSMSNILY